MLPKQERKTKDHLLMAAKEVSGNTIVMMCVPSTHEFVVGEDVRIFYQRQAIQKR
jgi:hypothetical protein